VTHPSMGAASRVVRNGPRVARDRLVESTLPDRTCQTTLTLATLGSMSRRRDVRRWHIGDQVRAMYVVRLPQRVGFTERVYWHRATVEAVRGDRIVVREFGYLRDLPAYAIQPLVHERRPWRTWSHDKRRGRISR
jgi:hypothetical protein